MKRPAGDRRQRVSERDGNAGGGGGQGLILILTKWNDATPAKATG